MFDLLATVLIASLLGSLHCAGMCGAFVAFAVGSPAGRSRTHLQIAYHGGRLITYTLLGALAGFVGSQVNLGGSRMGIQRSAAVAAGALMIALGLVALLRLAGARIPKLPTPKLLQNVTLAGHKAAARFTPTTRALTIGLLTTLLPCGWLWWFVIWAGGTGSALGGATVMASFWLGTVPILATMGIGIQQLTPRLRAYVPAVTALLLLAMGAWTLLWGAGMHGRPAHAMSTVVVKSPGEIARDIKGLGPAKPPCCQNEATTKP